MFSAFQIQYQALVRSFLPVVEKRAPIRRRRVKHPTLPQWPSSEIIKAMKLRDRLKRDKKFEDYKKQRNKVTSSVRAAKKAYFAKLINDSKDTASLWRAMTEITHKSRNKAKTAEIKCSPNVFNNHFLSLTDAILKSADTRTSSDYKIPTSLKKFCKDRISSNDSFKVPPLLNCCT